MFILVVSLDGWLLVIFQKQPQITSDLSFFSTNHVYAFLILSLLGLFSYYMKNLKGLFVYLFFISIFLELCHSIIPQRSFEYKDLFGNVFGVFIVFLTYNCYQSFKKIMISF